MGAWLIPILAAMAGGAASAGAGKLMESPAPKPPGALKPMQTAQDALQGQQGQDLSQDDVLAQYLAAMAQRKAGGYGV